MFENGMERSRRADWLDANNLMSLVKLTDLAAAEGKLDRVYAIARSQRFALQSELTNSKNLDEASQSRRIQRNMVTWELLKGLTRLACLRHPGGTLTDERASRLRSHADSNLTCLLYTSPSPRDS